MSKMYNPLYGCIEQKVAIVPLKIVLNGSAAVTSFVGKGVLSVTKNGTGVYDVILKDKYNKLLSVHFAMEAAAVSDITLQLKSEAVASKLFSILTHDLSVAADTAVAQTIHVNLIVTKSSVA